VVLFVNGNADHDARKIVHCDIVEKNSLEKHYHVQVVRLGPLPESYDRLDLDQA
jgi:hypothetical protein